MPRTRSDAAHRKVLDAALELVAERGIEATSMDAIAAASGVSKATIYKHWKDKDALLLEMLGEVTGLHDRPLFDSGDVRADLINVLSYRPPEDNPMRARIMPHLIAYSARNQEFGDAWRKAVMEPPRRELRRLLREGVKKGDLVLEIEEDAALAVLIGPIMYWYVFFRRTNQKPLNLARATVETFWRAYGK